MYPTIACALICYLAMLNSSIWRWGFPLPHTLSCVLIYWFVNIQFWFCKWCHKLWGSETLKPINRVMRKQECISLHCYLTFALTIRHFKNKQAIYLWLWKLQADSKSSCLITHSSCTASAVLLPPLTLAPKITHVWCLPCDKSEVDRAITPLGAMMGYAHDTCLLVCCSSQKQIPWLQPGK